MSVTVVRRATGGAVLAAAAALLAWAGPPDVTGALASGQSVDQQIAQLAGLAAWACLLWLCLGALAALAAGAPGALGAIAGRVCARITPPLVRRAVEAALGAAVLTSSLGAAAVPALAHTAARATVSTARLPGPVDAGIGDRPAGPPMVEAPVPGDGFDRPTATPTASPVAPVASTGPTPDHPKVRTTTKQRPDPRTPRTGRARLSPKHFVLPQLPAAAAPLPVLAGLQARSTNDEIAEVVVRRGDTLWAIASRQLGADATAAEIDAEWRRWYAANRGAVGPDPDLIRPGLRLAPPR